MCEALEESDDALDLLLHIQEDMAEIEGQLRDAVAQLSVDTSAAVLVAVDYSPPSWREDGLDSRFLALLALAGFSVSGTY